MRWVALALMLWASAAPAETVAEMQVPEGWPWLLGNVTGTLGKKAVAWETYDFSIGALDASVWAGESMGMVSLHLRGLPPGEPESDRGVLVVTADLGPVLKVGQGEGLVVAAIYRGKNREGARMVSDLASARVVIESLTRSAENINYGEVSGTVRAQMCPVGWLGKSCQPIELHFKTGMQFDGDFEVIEGKL